MQGITGTKMPTGHTRFGLPFDATFATSPSSSRPWGSSGPSPTVLDSIDDAIEGAEAVIAATEQLRDSLLHQLLTRGVPGWHTQWKEAPGLGTIPADWEVVRLGDVALESTTYGTNAQLGPKECSRSIGRMNNLQDRRN